MGQEQSETLATATTPVLTQNVVQRLKKASGNRQIEGILKFSRTPFADSQKMQIEGQVFFVEKHRMNLKQLLQSKIRLKKKFEADEVMKIIKDISYTLANLESYQESYPLLTLENIYFCNGNFKLMSPQVIANNILLLTRQNIKNRNVIPVSPEIILAIRCKQTKIKDPEVLLKSNIFSMGMIMLEICSLKSYTDCYDNITFDIINPIINERIGQIQAFYDQKITMLIANMLDYDLEERMNPRELSILVTRLLQQKSENPSVFPETQKIQNKIIQPNITRGLAQISKRKSAPPPITISQSEIINKETQRSQKVEPYQKLELRNKICEKIKKDKYLNKIPKREQLKTLSRSKSKNKLCIAAKTKKQILPNPYANQNLRIQLKTEQSKLKHSYSKVQKFDYSQNHNSSPLKARDMNLNLKYKYNVDGEEAPKSHRKYGRQTYQQQKQNYNRQRIKRINSTQEINEFNLTPPKEYFNQTEDNDYALYIQKVRGKGDPSQQFPKQKQNRMVKVDEQPKRGKAEDKSKSDSLKMIQKEIERSKKILEEVRRIEELEMQE